MSINSSERSEVLSSSSVHVGVAGFVNDMIIWVRWKKGPLIYFLPGAHYLVSKTMEESMLMLLEQ